jgi:hypothetical protein
MEHWSEGICINCIVNRKNTKFRNYLTKYHQRKESRHHGEMYMNRKIKKIFSTKLDAVGIIEIILILVILIGLVLLFKDQIGALIEKAIEAITGDVKEIVPEG